MHTQTINNAYHMHDYLNSYIILCFAYLKSNRTPGNILLLNLAVADMMVALFITPRFIWSHFFIHPDGIAGTLLCKLLTSGNLTWVGGAASIFTMVAIAFERYYAVIYPHSKRGKLTYNKVKVCGANIKEKLLLVWT